jgi:2-oxoglutarate dehydrogenase E1 component
MNRDFGINQGLVEELFLRWCANPSSVPDEWRQFFDELPPEEQPELTSAGAVYAPRGDDEEHGENGAGNGQTPKTSLFLPPTAEVVHFVDRRGSERAGPDKRGQMVSVPPTKEVLAGYELQGRVSALLNAYRVRGHLYAQVDPLGLEKPPGDELNLKRYGLERVDPETVISTGDFSGPPNLPMGELIRRLEETYCRTIGVEFTFVEDPNERRWLQNEMESTLNRLDMTEEDQLRILTKLTDAEIFEQFLHTNYVGAKRFSLEGAESFIPLMDRLIDTSASLGVKEIVIGMAHRGRLNVLANIMGKKLHEIFADFEDDNPEDNIGRGDVKYHNGYSTDRTTPEGNEVHLTLCFNPSHLEFVNPVVEGRTRAKQDRASDLEHVAVLPLLIHGDAAFAGQGIVMETLNLGGLDGYSTGGTVHIVVNNQIGFTTMPRDSRSTRYCTDVARMLRVPVFHVNGEDPEAVAQVVKLAAEFRQRYHKDVIIDVYGYRKYGHNEGDEPRFTQPMMYGAVDSKRTVRQVYVEKLVETGKVTQAQADEIVERRRVELEAALQETRNHRYKSEVSSMQGLWQTYEAGLDADVPFVETGVDRQALEELLRATNRIPDGFDAHPKIARLYKTRVKQAMDGKPFDWGTAETLAYATLLAEGTRVRITGQDSRRGTFSHRHAAIYDMGSGERYVPLNHLADDQARLSVFDSPLSEAGVLGFEFGYSLDSPDALVIWEAQFGDFANGAQVIIDQFISSCEDKWHRLSGLTMLLPHGFEGQGPEHSSARLERWLDMCAEDNMQVVNLTTPAQIFHCLRRQVVRPWRKPLVVMSPKSLLRNPMARSTLDDLASGTFQRILPDTDVDPKSARRVILCTGKVYYDLVKAREERDIDDVAIVRIEQLYPMRAEQLKKAVEPYGNTELYWVQEEPWNMGPWFYVNARFSRMLGRKMTCVARQESASPATGSKAAHVIEHDRLMNKALG